MRRAARWRSTRSVSRKVRSGTTAARRGQASIDTPRSCPLTDVAATTSDVRRGRALWLLQSSASFEHGVQRSVQLSPGRFCAGWSYGQDEIRVRRELWIAGTERFPQAAPDTVAHDGIAHSTANRNAHSRRTALIWCAIEHEQWVGNTAGRQLANAPKLGWRSKAFYKRALHVASVERESQGADDSDDRQAFAPAQAATFEHRAASRGQHAFEEAMLPLTRDAFRLVGTLRHGVGFLASSCQWRSARERLARSAAPRG